MSWEDTELKKVDKALNGPVYLTVFASKVTWRTPDGKVKGWKVLVEQEHERPFWITTYYESLTRTGMQEVMYAQNAKGERIIKPYGKVE